jgi:polysaccharide biosynthesis protein PelD
MRQFVFGQWLKASFGREALAPESITSRAQWVEIAVISLGAIAVAWWVTPTDPTLVQQSFPWLWFAPLLVALRYGVLPSLLSVSVVVGNFGLAWQLGRLPDGVPEASLFGGGLMVLLCGEFSDVWRDRNKRMEEAYLYMSERLARLTKRHLLLNLSHDRLEQEMLARPGSLRDALARLRLLSTEATTDNPMPGSNGLLQLLSQYVSIESAQIYLLESRDSSYVLGRSIAQLGDPAPMAADDELLQLVLEKGGLAHIVNQEASLQRHTSQLVVAPLVAGDSELVGVLAVTRMPFFSLTDENLQMMLVMLGYFADNLRSAAGVASIQQRLPDMPYLFAQELARLLRLHQKVALPSHLVVMHFAGSRRQEIPAEFLRIKRGLDLYWQTYVQDIPVLVVLMPFASSSAKDGFFLRVEEWLQSRFQGDFVTLKIQVQVIDFDGQEPLAELAEAVGRS